MYSTALPMEFSFTPWNRLGNRPADHWRAAMGCIWPPLPAESSTTKPGRSSVSAPRPYSAHEPMLGRPAMMEPVFMMVWAGAWLICSVHMESDTMVLPPSQVGEGARPGVGRGRQRVGRAVRPALGRARGRWRAREGLGIEERVQTQDSQARGARRGPPAASRGQSQARHLPL